LIVAIDTITKWLEAEPVGRITKVNTVKFLHGIIRHFGIPNQLISDNGTQFISKKFENFCVAYGIKHPRSSVNHPMTNENVERANGIILQGIKTRIFDRLKAYDKKWAQEVLTVLRSMRTTSSRATGETPFFLMYGAKVVLPPDIRLKSPQVLMFFEEEEPERRNLNLMLLEEERDRAAYRVQQYQQSLQKYHNQRVRSRALSIGDLVLKKDQRTKDKTKLSSPWQGPYIVEITRLRAYRLAEIDGDILPNTWNMDQLRHFYA